MHLLQIQKGCFRFPQSQYTCSKTGVMGIGDYYSLPLTHGMLSVIIVLGYCTPPATNYDYDNNMLHASP